MILQQSQTKKSEILDTLTLFAGASRVNLLAFCARDYKEPKQIAIPKIRVKEATKQGYAEATIGDSINLSYPNSKTRRGRVGKQIANTLLTGESQGVVEPDFRIRVLTPREYWRLQGFPDWAFDKAQEVNSNSQLYKQAGNSVTVNVIEAIAREF